MRTLIFILIACVSAWATTTDVVHIQEDGGGDWTTLSAAENGEDRDLTASDEIVVLQLEETWSAADTSAVTVDGWTTDSTRYIEIRTDATARHTGKWDADAYTIDVDSTNAINVYENFVRIYGLQIEVGPVGANSAAIVCAVAGTGSSATVMVAYNIIRGAAGSGTYSVDGIKVTDADYTMQIWNNVVAGLVNSTSLSTGIHIKLGTVYAYNNTVDGCAVGMWGDATVCVAVNNIVNDAPTAANSYVGTFTAGTDYNATDSTDNIGEGANNHTSHTFSFVDEANYDFHLQAADAGAKDLGTSDPGSGLFSDDIDSATRSGSWDIGADEYTSAGGAHVSSTTTFPVVVAY